MKRMGNPALESGDHFTYRHYKTWPDEERWELIDGHAWAMSPAPTTRHQRLSRKLFDRIENLLEGRPCEAFYAPFDVVLPKGDEPEDEVDTIVQPDIVVYCDRSKLTKAGARGAPDISIEILSPSTSKKDLNDKFRLYERHGVREYWVVDPAGDWLCVYCLGLDGRFDEGELRDLVRDSSSVASTVLEGLAVDPRELFSGLE
jgi:Uma2 family endonuclease